MKTIILTSISIMHQLLRLIVLKIEIFNHFLGDFFTPSLGGEKLKKKDYS